MRREPTFDQPIAVRRDFPEAGDRDDAIMPLRAPEPFSRGRLLARIALAAAIIAGLSLFARDRVAPAGAPRAWAEPRTSTAGLAPKLVTVPGPLLVLAGAEPPAKADPPRWNPATGLREDALTQGRFDAIEAPFLRLTLAETAPLAAPLMAPEPARSLFVALARRAAEMQGLAVVRTGLRGVVETKFGRFETVEATLSGEGTRLCTGFASLETQAMRIDGWLCGILGSAPEPRAIACAIDRLNLAIAAPPPMEVAFGAAALRRGTACEAQTSGETAAGTRPARIGDETGSIAGRKNVTDAPKPRRSRKNEAELRRNAQAGL